MSLPDNLFEESTLIGSSHSQEDPALSPTFLSTSDRDEMDQLFRFPTHIVDFDQDVLDFEDLLPEKMVFFFN